MAWCNRMLIIIAFSIFISSCDQPLSNFEGGDPSSHNEKAYAASDAGYSPSGQKYENGSERKLLKEGNINFESKDNKDTYNFITALCKEFNAYIANEDQNNYESRLEQSLTVRIPADNFDAFVARLEKLAVKVDNKSINVKDVTEEFIDIEARLKTKKELENRYSDLLKQAKTVKDVIAVESQLSNVRAEVESMEGRLKFLNNRVAYGTLNLSFYEETGADFGFASKFVTALSKGWDNLLSFLIGVIYLWPFIILASLSVYFFGRWRKKRKLKPVVQAEGQTR